MSDRLVIGGAATGGPANTRRNFVMALRDPELFQHRSWRTIEPVERDVSHIPDRLHAFGRRVVSTGGEVSEFSEKLRGLDKQRLRIRKIANIVADCLVFPRREV